MRPLLPSQFLVPVAKRTRAPTIHPFPRRVADHAVEAGFFAVEHVGEPLAPVEAVRVDRRVVDQRVAVDDVFRQLGQRLAGRGRANPEGKLRDLDRFGRQIDAVGATRNTGLLTTELLLKRGDSVTALVRPSSDRSALKALGAQMAEGDALDIDSLRAALADGDYDAVISTFGCFRCEPPPDAIGNINLIKAAQEAGVTRFVLVTTIGAGDSFESSPAFSRRVLGGILPLKTEAEEALEASGLEWTIVRPGGLRTGIRLGDGVLSEDRKTFGYIFREDLAELIVAVLDDDRTVGRTFAAVNPNRSFPWSNE